MRRSYNDLGVIIKTQDYGEADKIISIITENHGLVHYFAVGARKSSSKKSSHIDLLSQIKFSASGSGNQNYLQQVESLNFFSKIKEDLKKVSLAFSFTEIIYNLLPTESEDRETYISTLNFFKALNESDNTETNNQLSRKFAEYLLRHLGYPPPPKSLSSNLSSYFETLMNKKIISKEIS